MMSDETAFAEVENLQGTIHASGIEQP